MCFSVGNLEELSRSYLKFLKPEWFDSGHLFHESAHSNFYSAINDYQVEFLERLTQNELVYFALMSILYSKCSQDITSNQLNKSCPQITDNVKPNFDHNSLEEIRLSFQKHSKLYLRPWDTNALIFSRLDKTHSEQLGFSIVKALKLNSISLLLNAFRGFMNLEPLVLERECDDASLTRGLKLLLVYGPTDQFRQELFQAAPFSVKNGTFSNSSIPSTSLSNNISRLIRGWTKGTETPLGGWLMASAAKVFFDMDQVVAKTSIFSRGIMFRDPSPEYIQAATEIYRLTQNYYNKSAFLDVYRGLAYKIIARSYVESWTADRETAEKFGTYLLYDRVPIQNILMSWESMSGYYPPESELKGKQEVVVISHNRQVKYATRKQND